MPQKTINHLAAGLAWLACVAPATADEDQAPAEAPQPVAVALVAGEGGPGPKSHATKLTRAFVGLSVDVRVAAAPADVRTEPLEPSPPTRCRPDRLVELDELPEIVDPFVVARRRHATDSAALPRGVTPPEAAAVDDGLLVELAPDEEPVPEKTDEDPESRPVAVAEQPAPVTPTPAEDAAVTTPDSDLPGIAPGVTRAPRRLPTGDVPLPLDPTESPRRLPRPVPNAESLAEADKPLPNPADDAAPDAEDAVPDENPDGSPVEPRAIAEAPRGDEENSAEDVPSAAADPVPEPEPEPLRVSGDFLIPADDPVAARVAEAIDVTGRRILSTDEHTPWQIAHGLLAMRNDYVVRVDGEQVNVLDWVSTNPVHDGKAWFQRTRYGAKPQPFTVPYAFEGHPNQFLAFMTMADLPDDYSVVIDRRRVPFNYFVRNAQASINDREETSWTLWMLANVLDTDSRWYNEKREVWDFPKMLRKEMSQPVTAKACGGNHGLFALVTARAARVRSGKPFYGVWRQTHQFIGQHFKLAEKLQNPDGSLSSNYYKGREQTDDPSKRVSTSGHTLEFLAAAATKEQLREPWLRKAAMSVADDLVRYQSEPLEVGGMYHALDALVIYRERTFTKRPEPTPVDDGGALPLAERPGDTVIR